METASMGAVPIAGILFDTGFLNFKNQGKRSLAPNNTLRTLRAFVGELD